MNRVSLITVTFLFVVFSGCKNTGSKYDASGTFEAEEVTYVNGTETEYTLTGAFRKLGGLEYGRLFQKGTVFP